MSHLHIPDGVLAWWWSVGGYALAIGMLFYIGWRLRHTDYRRKVALLGIMSAVMIVGMSCEFVPIAYHPNLSILAAIILGPALGFCAAFITDFILALVGHGGITMVGLNTLVIGAEMCAGWFLFRSVQRLAPEFVKRKTGLAVGMVTVLALFFSTWLMIGVVAGGNVDPAGARDTGSLNATTLHFENPLSEGVFANRIITPEHEGEDVGAQLRLDSFIKAIMLLGLIGWVIEGAITGAIIAMVARMRPDLIETEQSLATPGVEKPITGV